MKEKHRPGDWLGPDRVETISVNPVSLLDGGREAIGTLSEHMDQLAESHAQYRVEFAALRAVADAARAVEEEAATMTWRPGRDGTITNETGRKAWRTMVTALDTLRELTNKEKE